MMFFYSKIYKVVLDYDMVYSDICGYYYSLIVEMNFVIFVYFLDILGLENILFL